MGNSSTNPPMDLLVLRRHVARTILGLVVDSILETLRVNNQLLFPLTQVNAAGQNPFAPHSVSRYGFVAATNNGSAVADSWTRTYDYLVGALYPYWPSNVRSERYWRHTFGPPSHAIESRSNSQ